MSFRMTAPRYRFLRDPLIRRFLSGSLFAGAFIWVAVTQFEVPTEIVWVFFKLSFIFVGVMMVIGLLLTPVIALLRRRDPGMLARLDRSDPDQTGGQDPDDPAR